MAGEPWGWSEADLAALSAFLRDRCIGDGPVTTARLGDGHSNLTFRLTVGDRQVVVRRPPHPPGPPRAHDVLREARFIGGLASTDVPVPELLATAVAGEVLDVPLYVMGLVDGPVVTAATSLALADPHTRRAIGWSLVDTLATLHAVDPAAAGLADLGRADGFNLRHLGRIATLAGYPDLPAQFIPGYEWLCEHVPPESGASVIHNDYRLGNVVLAPTPPGRVAAVLDWELATVGDPLVDLAAFLTSVPVVTEPSTPTQELGRALLEDGYPSRAELTDRYAERTGRDLSRLGWYLAFACWKLAVLYDYSHRRALRGEGDPYYLDPAQVPAFLAAADRAAR